jgi:hypothetical protein
MLDHISAGVDGWTLLNVVAVLAPALGLLWIILTVSALHKRDAYFWSLGSTWTSIVACPVAMVIMSLGSWSQVNGPDAPLFHAPIVAGTILYLVAFGYAILYNYKVTKSAVLAVSTSILQQLARTGRDLPVPSVEGRRGQSRSVSVFA